MGVVSIVCTVVSKYREVRTYLVVPGTVRSTVCTTV